MEIECPQLSTDTYDKDYVEINLPVVSVFFA